MMGVANAILSVFFWILVFIGLVMLFSTPVGAAVGMVILLFFFPLLLLPILMLPFLVDCDCKCKDKEE